MEFYCTEKYKGYIIDTYYDDNLLNPRIDIEGNLATFVCKHREYQLGDKHDVRQELLDLIYKHCSLELVEQYMTKYHSLVKIPNEEYDKENNYGVPVYSVQIQIESGRAFDKPEVLEWPVYDDEEGSYKMITDYAEELSFSECLDLLESSGKIRTAKISVYEHGNIKIYLGTPDDRWDSGTVGFAYLEKDKIMKEKGGVTEENWKEEADYCMKQEMNEYSAYVEGACFCYVVYDLDGNEMDSGGTYFGWDQLDILDNDARNFVNALMD